MGGGQRLGGGIEQKGKKTHGHGQQWRDCGSGEGSIRGLNSNGKNTINFFLIRLKIMCSLQGSQRGHFKDVLT